MTKALKANKLFFLAVLVIVSCMAILAYAATVTTVEIWHPETGYQAPGNTVYMYSEENVEKLAWKTVSSVYNPDILIDATFRAARHATSTDTATPLLYSYTFNGSQIQQGLVQQQPYYLYILNEPDGDDEIDLTLGCRTMFPMPMTIKVPTGWDEDQAVNIAYVTGSCDGYVVHQADEWDDLMAAGGNPNYMNGFASYLFTPPAGVTADADGYVAFITHHGGRYTITKAP